MHQALGSDLKLIFCLRDPANRAFSQYHLCCRLLEETESFEAAIQLEAERVAADPIFGRRRAYLGASRYLEQIERFLPFFARENMFFMVLEQDFVVNRAQTVARLFEFLGVGADRTVKLDVEDSSNRAPWIRVSTPEKPLRQKTKGRFEVMPPGTLAIQNGQRLVQCRHSTPVTLDRPASAPLGGATDGKARSEAGAAALSRGIQGRDRAARAVSRPRPLELAPRLIRRRCGRREPPRSPTGNHAACGRGC
jgi:sulfotransferase family protein